MKRIIYIIGFFLLFVNILPVTGQSKKFIREHKIKLIKVLEERPQKSDDKILESLTRFDEHGNIIEEIEYNNEGKLKSHRKYEYDKSGNRIKEIEFDEDGKVISKTVYTFQQGLRKEKVKYDEKGKIKYRKIYIYETE